jgi:hypothetical protein
MNDKSKQTDTRKLQHKYISNFDNVHSQDVSYLFNKIKKTIHKKH